MNDNLKKFDSVEIKETETVNGGLGSFTLTVDPNTGEVTCSGSCPVGSPGFPSFPFTRVFNF